MKDTSLTPDVLYLKVSDKTFRKLLETEYLADRCLASSTWAFAAVERSQ